MAGLVPDEALILELRGGKREAFAELFVRHRTAVWRFFRRRVADPGRAEELAQEVFVAILAAAPRYEPTGTFRSYLFGIAYRILLADQRKTAARQTVPLAPDAAVVARGGDPEVTLWIREALARLDPDDRETLMLREYEELRYDEIAALRGVPLNTVKSRLFRARMALRDILQSDQNIVRTSHGAR